MGRMGQLVRDSALDPEIRRASLDLIQSTYATNYQDFVYGLRNFFLRHFQLIDEPDEMITSPSRLLRAIRESGVAWGDCDDAALLAASMFYSLGFAVRFRAIVEMEDGSFGHVFTEYRAPDSQFWKVFDPTVKESPVWDSSLVVAV